MLLPPARVLGPVHVVGPLGAGVPDQSQYEGESNITISVARVIIDVPVAIVNQACHGLAYRTLRRWSDGAIFEATRALRQRYNTDRRLIVEGSLDTRTIRVYYWGGIHVSGTTRGLAEL